MVQSLRRAFEILGTIAAAPAGVSEIARRLDLPKTTAARLLNSLREIGAVEVNGDSRYVLGPMMRGLAASSGTDHVTVLAQPYLNHLARTYREAACLSLAEGRFSRYVAHVAPDRDVKVRDWTGELLPAYSVSPGLAHLAYCTEAEIDDVISAGLDPLTEHTVTEEADLRARLAQAREDGFVWAAEESFEGLAAVAAPVIVDGVPVASLSIYGPTFRFPGSADPTELGEDVRRVADELAKSVERSNR